jgi:hypothetical protein
VRYPGSQETEVPRAWTGQETPQPAAPPGGFPSGYPITILARPGYVWTSAQLCLHPGNTCTDVPSVVLVNSTDSHVPPHAAHIYAHKPLQSSTRYGVRFKGTKDGNPYTTSWFFRTRGGSTKLVTLPRSPGPSPTQPR